MSDGSGVVSGTPMPGQKQPSTNTATRSTGNTKSGRPNTGRFLRHPLIPCERKIEIILNSVERFPRERTRDMTSERLVLVNTSAIDTAFNGRRDKGRDYNSTTSTVS